MGSKDQGIQLILNAEHNLAVDLTEDDRYLLWHLLNYYNGSKWTHNGESFLCGYSRPPSLRQLLQIDRKHLDLFESDVLPRLRDYGMIKADPVYLCRTKVAYAPTQRGRLVIDRLFDDVFPKIYGDVEFDKEDVSTESVLAGEQNEGLTHRFGVLEVYYSIPKSNTTTLYPTRGGRRADVYTTGDAGDYRIEVQSGHNDYQQIVDKYNGLASCDETVIWVFPDAHLAARTINLLEDRADAFDCVNAPFRNPENYRPNRLKEYLDRRGSYTPGMNLMTTFDDLLNIRINEI